MYATKRRRRNVKNYKHPPKESQKSNPSKRHRERLNAELENLASLLPFEQNILTKLDKLSILRLAVSYLRIKSYFQANLKSSIILQQSVQHREQERLRFSQICYADQNFSEGNAILESLNGFILIVNTNSEVFYASRTVEQFIGFHQSDIIHQSVFELIHSEDREEFKKHLSWNSKIPADKSNLTLNEVLASKELSKYLERNFTVRFRCLLDNTSGFLTLDIVGRLSVLHGQRGSFQVNSNGDIINPPAKSYGKGKNSKNSAKNIMNDPNSMNQIDQEPMLALFAVACPFGPPSLFELPQRDSLFKSKHKVNMAPISLDSKGKLILGYTDVEISQFGGYDLIHFDDLKYFANAHKELLKTGSCGLICYRMQTSNKTWQWLQSSMRIIYKSNKPECALANHRPLTDEEGEELFYKRGFEFKLPYPCLYDFESNFTNATNNTNEANTSSISATSNPTMSNTVITKPNQNTEIINAIKQQPHYSTQQPTTPKQVTKTATSGGIKTKSSKTNKALLLQQRNQQQQQQQSHLLTNYQAPIDETHLSHLQNSYKFNSNYLNHQQQHHLETRNDYYMNNLKGVLAEENLYDSPKTHINTDYPASSVSSSSSASSSSSSSSLIPSESISINISNPTYHYTNYFNGLNQSYNYSSNINESNKFYSAAASGYSNGLFYGNSNFNSNYHYQNSNPNSIAANSLDTPSHNSLISSNLHSNNSSSSICSSTSSSCSGSNINGFDTYNLSNNQNGLVGTGIIWPDTENSLASTKLSIPLPNEQNHLHLNYENSNCDQFVSNHGQQQLNSGLNPYNDIINCANNAAALAAAKYSCAAAASTYGSYPFAVDEYNNSSVSQIQL